VSEAFILRGEPFGPSVALERVKADTEDLHNCELGALSGATARRRGEFASGRRAARKAMQALGLAAASVTTGEAGEPIFPAPLVGSIGHSRFWAVAAASLRSIHRSVGVDIDDGRPLSPPEAAFVGSPSEFEAVTSVGWAQGQVPAALVVFGLKEAIFKCQYPITKARDLGFLEVQLQIRGGVLTATSSLSGVREVIEAVRLSRPLAQGQSISMAELLV
jgi:enterobactin synthetase component D